MSQNCKAGGEKGALDFQKSLNITKIFLNKRHSKLRKLKYLGIDAYSESLLFQFEIHLKLLSHTLICATVLNIWSISEYSVAIWNTRYTQKQYFVTPTEKALKHN